MTACRTTPGAATLQRLLAAAGFDMVAELVARPVSQTHMLDDVTRILRLTPEQRLLEVANLSRFERAARRV